ncbi:hypothetical protein KGM_205433 [Danaus plexippus plexippus]|uniref:Uncharacterized protein n=1 Tax=Danaus plexippus plexippus TaxID=278856 RepID=A0A212F1R5_DANPL|nr:hypothetical protein KGM_205433 [Danaus plexippus plexippus]
MKLYFFTICLFVLLAVVNSMPCSGPRCKRMTNKVAKLYDYDYGGYNGGYNDQGQSGCSNCGVSDFGNGDYNQNEINIEKK